MKSTLTRNTILPQHARRAEKSTIPRYTMLPQHARTSRDGGFLGGPARSQKNAAARRALAAGRACTSSLLTGSKGGRGDHRVLLRGARAWSSSDLALGQRRSRVVSSRICPAPFAAPCRASRPAASKRAAKGLAEAQPGRRRRLSRLGGAESIGGCRDSSAAACGARCQAARLAGRAVSARRVS
jgi:hypothetical protein